MDARSVYHNREYARSEMIEEGPTANAADQEKAERPEIAEK